MGPGSHFEDVAREGGSAGMAETPFDIHICYRAGDREIAATLARRLEQRGVSTRYDAGIGARTESAAGAEPDTARVLVILVSSEMHDGQELRRELAAADRLSRPVAILLLEDVVPSGATLEALADRVWIRTHPDPLSHIDEIVGLLATLAGKGAPPAPPPAPETLEGQEKSIDAAISDLLTDTIDPARRAPTEAIAYVGRAESGGQPAPKRGGAMAGLATIATLGIYGAMARRDALKRFRANAKRL